MSISGKSFRWIKRILLLGTFLAAVKMIFFDYTMDEEYQIVMAYRSISGDSLFVEMWEPHQTSAFLCAILMRLYYAVTGTWTCVILYLRVCTALIQIAVTWFLYRSLCRLTESGYAFLLSLIYFNILPKGLQIPDFSNMQLWFFTLLVLSLFWLYRENYRYRKWGLCLLISAGIWMSLLVLSYPSLIILFPFFCVYIFRNAEKPRVRDCLIFAGTCTVCALVWLLFVLRNISLGEFLRNLSYTVGFDSTHEINGATEGKLSGIFSNLLGAVGLTALISGISAGIIGILKATGRWKYQDQKAKTAVFGVIAVLAAQVIQLVLWVVLEKGYEFAQIHLLAVLLAGALAWRFAGERKKVLSAGIIGSLLTFAAVIYLSNLVPYHALPYGCLGVIFCALVLVWALENCPGDSAVRWSCLLLVSFCLTCIIGKGYTIKNGRDYQTVLETGAVMRYGPAAGILTDDWNAWIYNANYEDFTANIEDGDTVLIVSVSMLSEDNTAYLLKDVGISHYSVVDPADYEEELLIYWELYPEKQPDVIVVETWYGGRLVDEDSWIMEYIENEFGYTSVTDGTFMRFYRR